MAQETLRDRMNGGVMLPQLLVVRDTDEGMTATFYGYQYTQSAVVRDRNTGVIFYEYVLSRALQGVDSD